MSYTFRSLISFTRARTSQRISRRYAATKGDDDLPSTKSSPSELQKVQIDDESPDVPKKCVFQELRLSQCSKPIYTIEEAAISRPMENLRLYFKYQNLAQQHTDSHYALRGIDNEHSLIFHFPELTDFLIVGSGLVGSAAAYYTKKLVSRVGDVLVIDQEPYSPHNCTALCNGLISCQSKSRDISRMASLSKELIRNLRNDILVTKEDYAQIKYQPCTHLILWPEHEVDEVMKSIEIQNADGCFTEAKLPNELEADFPWLKVVDSDVALGSHGNQDEALVDPIGLRNLYRTLAQAHGANFIKAEIIDFNTMFSIESREVMPLSAGAVVARLPLTGELRNLGFAKVLLSLGHNTPYLEARSDLEPEMRDYYEDLHFLQPKLRVYFSFYSLDTPIINFPVLTDTDGCMLIRDHYAGDFKYYLTYKESEVFLDMDYDRFMNLDSEEPYPNLTHKSDMFRKYFDDVIKPKLVNRIPAMEDAEFLLAHSGFESYNSHDGIPVIGPHPYHSKVLISGGYGPRMMTYAPTAAVALTELMVGDEEELYDMTNFYWNRVIARRRVDEFRSLVNV